MSYAETFLLPSLAYAETLPFQSFWSSSWSAPLRAACIWLKRTPAPVVPAIPLALAPGWLRPLCLHRQIGQAINARLKWLREHPDQSAMLFPVDSIPLWDELAWRPFARSALHTWSDERLLNWFVMEVERLQRLLMTPPTLLGEALWTHAVLGTCEHLAQVYHEFRRRFGSRKVRRFVREVLIWYIYWEPPREPETPAEDEQAAPSPESEVAPV